jgi:uncharacterized protein YdeI (YjbR/CyaY-like superfamily)
VDLEPDTEIREVTVPPDLPKAFRRDAAARRAFERLSYRRQQRDVRSIDGAKTEEIGQRRIDTTIAELRTDA